MTIEETLALIPSLLDEVRELKEEVKILNQELRKKTDLTKVKNVAEYLDKTPPTIYNYISDGRFKLNVHYRKEIKRGKPKIVFIESAIEQFKREIA